MARKVCLFAALRVWGVREGRVIFSGAFPLAERLAWIDHRRWTRAFSACMQYAGVLLRWAAMPHAIEDRRIYPSDEDARDRHRRA